MNLTKKIEKLFEEKEYLLESIELCCKSIEFWEGRSNKVFKQMDELEEESIFGGEDFVQKKYLYLKKECEKLMNRVNFENQQLDKLEMETINLEEKIIKTLSSHAKKQKK